MKIKIKIYKAHDADRWLIAVIAGNDVTEVSSAYTWNLAMAQARWLMQHRRSA